MGKSKQAAKSVIIMIIFTLGSKFLGFIREVLIASKFGSGMETDAFFVALTASSLMTGFISKAISTTFVPVVSEIEAKEGKKGKIEHANNMMNVLFFISFLLLITGLIFSPIVVKVLAKGFQGEQYDLAIRLTRIGFPGILFSGLIGVMTGYLHSEGRFFSSSAIGLPFNFIFITFLLFMSARFGIRGLMITSVIATVSQFFIQIPEAKVSGYSYKFIFDLKDEYLKKVVMLSLPVLVGTAINELNIIVDRTIASDLVAGSISALSYASKLNALVNSVFIAAITTVIFPMLSKESSSGNIDGMKRVMGYGFNVILLITIPATVGIAVLAKPIVQVAFQRGEFDTTATLMTTGALFFYSFGLLAFSLRLLINKAYYSLQDTKTPMVNGAIYLVINVILNLILVKFMAHSGIALATSISSTITIILLIYKLRLKIGPMGVKSYVLCGLKAGLASAIMGALVYIIYNGTYRALVSGSLYNLLSLLTAIGVGVIIYIFLCYVFRVEEVRMVVKQVLKR